MPQTHYIRQSGAGATGFLLSALPILMLGLGGVELAHGLFIRQALSLALIQAGRAATVDHAHPDTLAQAFEQALLPLFPQTGSLPRALAQRMRDLGQAPWRIRIIQPQRTAFTDHADPDLRIATVSVGRRAVNHDYQMLQHQRRLQNGWPQGRGPVSGQTIFQANTLMLELIWPHEPLVPGIKALMRALSPRDESYRSHVLAHGYLPILRGASFAMQSHPVDWPDRDDGKVVHGEMSSPPHGLPVTCAGLWSQCAPVHPQAGPETGLPAMPIGDSEDNKGNSDSGRPAPPGDADSQPGDAASDAGAGQAPDCGINTCCEMS